MIDKLLKCRKDKKSDCCNRTIKSGEMYNKIGFKTPRFGEDNLQIGIEYLEIHICIDCYNISKQQEEQCKLNNHLFVEVVNTFGLPYTEYTGEYVCENCGVKKENQNVAQ